MFSSPSYKSSQSQRRRSKFTYRQLNQLASYATSTPLRTIAHVDLDAFYAQCELVRLGLEESTPLAVQQWQGLIAINYPARKFGLGRHITNTEAKKLCPDLVLQHVATWREGDERWAYHEDSFKNMATHKVSLDPYRLESRRILALIKETLPSDLQKVEKAGIDEVFLDLSAHVHSVLQERYPDLKNPPPYDDPSEALPWPSTSVIDWNADALVDLDAEQTEEDDPDWDDICLSIAAEIVRQVRAAIRDKLKYTCSGGIARNKMLAKLGSAHNKPNAQTVIRNRAIQHFLNGKKFTKIRNLGGKLGDEAVKQFDTDEVKDLIDIPLEQMQKKLGDDTGVWLYGIIRGQDNSEVNPRTQIKSMLSAKSFRPSINTFEQGVRWLRIFAADLFSRCVEEGIAENKRRPKTINLHHRSAGIQKTRQAPISQGKVITEEVLFNLAQTLLAQIVIDGRAWPCDNLSLSVGGFEDGITGNMGIKSFLIEGDEAKALIQRAESGDSEQNERPEKRRKVAGIQNFFSRHDSGESNSRSSTPAPTKDEDELRVDQTRCDKCGQVLAIADQTEHDDWHFAKDLEDEFRHKAPAAARLQQQPSSSKDSKPRIKAKGNSSHTGAAKGQMQLKFGNKSS